MWTVGEVILDNRTKQLKLIVSIATKGGNTYSTKDITKEEAIEHCKTCKNKESMFSWHLCRFCYMNNYEVSL